MKMRQVLGGIVLWMGMMVGIPTAGATNSEALSSMPRGISLENVFEVPPLSSELPNSARVVSSTNSVSSGTQGVQLTDDEKQVGAMWSTESNKINLSQDFTASMWLYFDNLGEKAGDGMAFVLQNSGASAITSGLSSYSPPGQTLGVWGMDFDASLGKAAVAEKGLQNSWALEFDEFANTNSEGNNNSGFDNLSRITGPHIASSYPGHLGSYVAKNIVGANSKDGNHYYTLAHNGLINTPLSDGKWHHLTLKWKAPISWAILGKMTYSFDDKDPNTGAALAGVSRSVQVNITKLGLTTKTIATTPIWWGFTGSTGVNFANNMVVFEAIPELVKADVDLKVTNLDRKKTVTNGSTVNGKDDLVYQYRLRYNGGRMDWQSIRANLDQDENVIFSKGKIEYADGSTTRLSASEVEDTTTIAHTLDKNLSAENNSAVLTLRGQAANVKNKVSVAPRTHYFSSAHHVASVQTPSFVIQPARSLTLRLDDKNATSVKPRQTINLAGQLTAANALNNKDITIHTVLDNDNPIDDFKLNGTTSDASVSGAFHLELPASKLTTGPNKVSFYATSRDGSKSNTVSVIVELTGALQFGTVAKAISFGTNQIPTKSKLLAAESDWVIDVNDLRANGAKWYVYATASPLVSDQHTLNGGLVYIDAEGNSMNMTNNATLVASGLSDDNDTHHVGGEWQQKRGIFLDVQPNVYAGNYQGTVDWSLMDTPVE